MGALPKTMYGILSCHIFVDLACLKRSSMVSLELALVCCLTKSRCTEFFHATFRRPCVLEAFIYGVAGACTGLLPYQKSMYRILSRHLFVDLACLKRSSMVSLELALVC